MLLLSLVLLYLVSPRGLHAGRPDELGLQRRDGSNSFYTSPSTLGGPGLETFSQATWLPDQTESPDFSLPTIRIGFLKGAGSYVRGKQPYLPWVTDQLGEDT